MKSSAKIDPKNIDFGYIIMTKQKETNSHVWYKFEIFIETGDHKIDKKGRKIINEQPLFGLFKFTKNELLVKNPNNYGLWASCISLEEIDPIFSNIDKNHIMAKCSVSMGKCLKNNNFTEKIIYSN
jgi:hypothetical protein